jgi:hypothetical protein
MALLSVEILWVQGMNFELLNFYYTQKFVVVFHQHLLVVGFALNGVSGSYKT